MRRNVRYVVAAAVALMIGTMYAEAYARLAIPYFAVVTAVIANQHPWRVLDFSVGRYPPDPGVSLRMTGEVRRTREDPAPAAQAVVQEQVGEVVETPIVFWTVVLAWPMATLRRRLICIAAGIPVFLVLETATAGCQLMYAMADASAILAGEADPQTAWGHWSLFLEAGGHFALALCAALLTVAVSRKLAGRDTIR